MFMFGRSRRGGWLSLLLLALLVSIVLFVVSGGHLIFFAV